MPPGVDMLKVFTSPNGVPTSHARTVPAASAVVRNRSMADDIVHGGFRAKRTNL